MPDKDNYRIFILRTAPGAGGGARDTASQRAVLTIANVLLLPFIPRSFDMMNSKNK